MPFKRYSLFVGGAFSLDMSIFIGILQVLRSSFSKVQDFVNFELSPMILLGPYHFLNVWDGLFIVENKRT